MQWFEAAPHDDNTVATGLLRLRWSYHQRSIGSGPTSRMHWFDLVPLRSLIEPMCIHDDPTATSRFFYNHFVRC